MLKHWLRRQRPRAQRIAPQAEWFEPRLLYSADAASLLGVDTALTPAAEERTLDASFEYTAAQAPAAIPADVRAAYALTPLQFEADAGQLGEGVDFAASGVGYAVRLGGGQAELLLPGADAPVRLELVGADPGTAIGQDLLVTRSNHLVGNDQQQWVTDIANYGSVLYRGVYDGIDVRYYGNQSRLEYDFLLAPGADASRLQLRFHGVDAATLDAHGDLLLRVAGSGRALRFEAPVSYQEGADGRDAVASRYELQPDGTVRIVVGAHDTTRTLVVDPVLSHASYFGEAGQETALGVAVGADGSVYVTGQTSSTGGSFAARLPSGSDNSETYVAKFNADLTSLVYATRVGGSSAEEGTGIAVDADGNAVVTGWTRSADFFTTPGADQAGRIGTQQQEAFVYKLNAAGNGFVFSTYFGSSGNTDAGASVALDSGGNVYVAGTVAGASDNAFVNKYTADGSSVFKLQYGGSGDDHATGVAVDSGGNVYIAGNTLSTDNVILNGAQPTRPGLDDAFLVKYDKAGTLAYATYIGSSKADSASGLAVDDAGRAYVVGQTREPAATGFATTAGAFATTPYTHPTGFLRIYDTRLTGAASLAYSTFVGGSKDATGTVSSAVIDSPTGVAVGRGQVAIVGVTDASDFPTTSDAYGTSNTSGSTGFVMVLAPQAGGSSDLIYGSYYGTGLTPGGVAWSGDQFYLAGSTSDGTQNLATPDGYKPVYGSGSEGVVALFSGFTNVAPMLAGANAMASQLEDVTVIGTLVSDLVAGRISDADGGALPGIAVTAVDSSNGTWEFTLNDGGSWSTLPSPAAGSALLLNADTVTRVRFVPAINYVGTSTIGFRAWDRTDGSAGDLASIARTGGSSAFSIGTTSVTATVTAVNDAPVRSGALPGTRTMSEGSAAVTLGLGAVAYGPGGGADETGQSVTFVATGLPDATGTIQLAGGTPVVLGDSYTLAELQGMTFLPGRTGTGSFTFSAKDDGGTADGGQDTLPNQTLSFSVTNVAPVLNAATVALPDQMEDVLGTGARVGDFMSGQVTDGGGAYGIAVVAIPSGNINGTWQYSLDGGASWLALGGTTNNSRLLGPDARIRFAGDAGENINGAIPGFTFRAWDGSSGVAGSTVSTSSTGGTTAFSSTAATASLYVTPVNDIPLRYNVGTTSFLPVPADVAVLEGTTGSTSLGLGYLQYIGGYALDEYQAPLTYRITAVPSGIGSVTLSGGAPVAVGDTYTTYAALQGMRFAPTAGVQSGSATLAWTVQDSDGTANGGVDTMIDQVTISVRNVAPTLSGFVPIPAMLEDAVSAGTQVSALVSGKIYDPSGTLGIAVTGTDSRGGGSWQWTRDGGSTWNSLAGASTSNAVLLQTGAQWRIRFLPSANWNSSIGGTPGITFRAWDQSTGIGGETADASITGGTSAFSSTDQTATITVTAVSDGPARTDVPTNPFPELAVLDGAPLTSLGLSGLAFGPGGGSDEAGQTVSSTYTVTALPSTIGTVWLADGTTPVGLGSYSLAQIQGMQFLSSGLNNFGTQNFSFTVTDNGSTANGGSNTSTFSVKVIVNRAPVLNGANSVLSLPEDYGGSKKMVQGHPPPWANSTQAAGRYVSELVAGQIVDTYGSTGIAITGKTGDGTWQYTLDGGTTWSNLASPADNSALLLAADAQTGLRFAPNADWNSVIGTASITFRAWDLTTGIAGNFADTTYNGGASAYSALTATSIATVTARNDAPVAFSPVGGTVPEGAAAVTILASGTYGPGPSTATDEATQKVTARFTTAIPDRVEILLADGVTVVNPADTTTTYTLAQFLGMQFRSAANATPGTAQIAFELVDDGGTANTSVDRQNFSLTLTVTNRAPVLYGANAMTGLLEDSADNGTLVSDLLTGQVSDPTATQGIAVTAVDNANGRWEYTSDGGTTWTAFGAPSASSARLLLSDAGTRVRFVPAADWSGTATLTFAAWDGTSGAGGGVGDATANGAATAFSLATASTSVTVSAVNDPPVGGVVGALGVIEDSGSTSLGLGSVSYGPGGGGYENGQSLTFTVTSLPAAAFGRVSLADGTAVTPRDYTITELRGMRFVTAANAFGSGSFTFAVKDDGGGSDTLLQAVAITIAPVNDAPVAGFDVVAGTEDTVLALAPATLLANDTDVDGDTLAITAVASGAGGTVALSGGAVVFTPDADFNGVGSFSYTVSDGNGGLSITGVVVNIAAVNDAPRPVADTVSGTEDQPATIAPATLLGNDVEVDGERLAITTVAAGTGGTVALSGGAIVFTPAANFNGAATFSYTVSDPAGATAIGSVTVNVAAVNDPPVANADTVTGTEDQVLTIAAATLLGNDTDAEADPLSIVDVAAGSGGAVALSGPNIVFTPAVNFNGAASFTYTVSDGTAGTTGSVTVNVAAVNDAPMAQDASVGSTEDVLLSGTVAAGDVDGDTLTYALVNGASHGTLAFNGDGSYTYQGDANWFGTDSFSFKANDGTMDSVAASVRIDVAAVNDAPVRSGELPIVTMVEGTPDATLGLANVSYTPGGGADESAQALRFTITALPEAQVGTLVLADGRTAVIAGGNYTWAQMQGMRFVPVAGVSSGSASIAFSVWDDGGTARGGADTLARQELVVRIVNQAPMLDGANAMPAILEDQVDAQGMRVADLIAGHVRDPGGSYGIAVTAAASAVGDWQYSVDGGARWSGFDGASTGSAQLLAPDARIRYVPHADWNGIATGLAFHAWDGSGGTAGAARADAAANGGSSPFSEATAMLSVRVQAVNDAPQALGVAPGQITVEEGAGPAVVDLGIEAYAPGGGGDESTQALTVVVTEVPAPEIGILVLADSSQAVLAGSSYTLEQLRGLRFVPAAGSAGRVAELAWRVRDDGGTADGGVDETAGRLRIVVIGQAAASTSTPGVPAAAPLPAAPVTAQLVADLSPATATRIVGGPAAQGGDRLVDTTPAATLVPTPEEFGFAAPRRVEAPEGSHIAINVPRVVMELQPVAFNPQGIDFELTGLSTTDSAGARFTLEHFQQSLRSGIFIEGLNHMRNQLREELNLDRTMVISVAGLSLGVSVAYVLWLVRGGVLLGSYLSALPAWRLLDPLPVLARAGAAVEDEDEETLDPHAGDGADPLRGFS